MIFKSKRKEKREACPIPSVQNKRVPDQLERLEKNQDCEIYNASRWFTVFGLESIVIFFKKPTIMPGYFLKIIHVHKRYNLPMI